MAPGSIFHHISFWSTILVFYLLSLQSFTFHSINQKYQKYYFTVYPSLSDLTLEITVKGLTTPLSCWVQVGVCLCRYLVACALSPTGMIPWFSKAEGNTYSTLLHHPFLFKKKTYASSRGSKNQGLNPRWLGGGNVRPALEPRSESASARRQLCTLTKWPSFDLILWWANGPRTGEIMRYELLFLDSRPNY